MAEVISGRELFVLVMLLLGSVFCSDVPVDVYVKTGDNCPLVPKVKGKLQTILWKYQGNKVVELEPSEYRWYKFQDQAQLNNDTGELTLLKMDKKRSGPYQSEIQMDGKLHNTEFNVVVMDPVPAPKVTCDANSTTATLLCSVDSSVQANFKWSGPNGFDFTGEKITISKEQSPETSALYICTAANKVNQESTHFPLEECNTASRVENPVPVGAIVGSVIGTILIAVIVGAVVWYKKRGPNIVNGTRYSRTGNDDPCVVVTTDNSVEKEKDGDDPPEKGSESAGQNGVTSSPAAPNDLDKSQTKDKDTPTIRTDEDDSVEKGSDGDAPTEESSEAAGQNGVTSSPGPDESTNEDADQSSTPTDKGGSAENGSDGEEQENPDESNATSNQADEDE